MGDEKALIGLNEGERVAKHQVMKLILKTSYSEGKSTGGVEKLWL